MREGGIRRLTSRGPAAIMSPRLPAFQVLPVRKNLEVEHQVKRPARTIVCRPDGLGLVGGKRRPGFSFAERDDDTPRRHVGAA
jgi:hypothetical protein